jgi:hypothetical protein
VGVLANLCSSFYRNAGVKKGKQSNSRPFSDIKTKLHKAAQSLYSMGENDCRKYEGTWQENVDV